MGWGSRGGAMIIIDTVLIYIQVQREDGTCRDDAGRVPGGCREGAVTKP